MKVFIVRWPPEQGGDETQWMGMAEDPIEAALFATTRGPFPLDAGDLHAIDSDANLHQVTIGQRLERLRPIPKAEASDGD